jgi:hypothetical protein
VIRNLVLSTLYALTIFILARGPQCAEAFDTTGDRQAGYAGSETCMECHEEYYASYMKDRHAVKADPRTPAAGLGCEACHGPGAAHAGSDGEEPIRSLKAQ